MEQVTDRQLQKRQAAWSWRTAAIAVSLILVALFFLWRALPPGLTLAWSVEGGTPAVFQIYRAPLSGVENSEDEDFVLLSELEARPNAADYTYLDLRLLPGQQYAYRLEVVNDDGLRAISQTVVRNSQDALPGQMALLIAVAVILIDLMLLLRGRLMPAPHRTWLSAL